MTVSVFRSGVGILSCALLAACGGGNNGSGTIVTPPGANPSTPTTSPSPGAGLLNTGEVKPTSDAAFIAATMELTTTAGTTSDLTEDTRGGTTSNRTVTLDTPGFKGSYNGSTGYSLSDSVNGAVFGRAQLVSDTWANEKNYPTVLFSRLSANLADYLALYRNKVNTSTALGSGSVEPKYAGIGGWQHSISETGERHTRLTYFAFGPATPTTDIPRSGIVKYSLTGRGNYAGDNALYFTTSLDEIAVDFDTHTISGSLSMGGTNFFSGNYGGIYSVRFSGTMSGNMVTGATESGVAVASGQFKLLFVGPNADELVLIHAGQDGRGDFVGSAVGVRNPYLP